METAVAEPPVDQAGPITHLAKCAECAAAVQYTPIGAHAFETHGVDQSYGIGPNGRPECPNGHGEMAIADDQLKPAEEAFTLAQEQLAKTNGTPVQGVIPGMLPAFNFEACLRDMAKQAESVDAKRKIYEDDAETAKASKKEWEKAEELLTKMGLTYSERIRQRDAGFTETPEEPTTGPRLVKCTFESKHPGAACLLCAATPEVRERMLGNPDALAPSDAEAHVEDVERYLLGLDVEETIEALQLLDHHVAPEVVASWTPEERKAVSAWADYQDDKAHGVAQADDDDNPAPTRPAVLGTPHVPQKRVDGSSQRCSICDAVLVSMVGGDVHGYDETSLVGVDCKGPKKEPARYPKRSGKKKAAKKAH